MIKIFIGKRDYKYTLSALLRVIKEESRRELTYSTDIDADNVDVYVNVIKLFSGKYIRKLSEESPEDIFLHIEEGLGIYVNGDLMSVIDLEDYIGGME
ncbi:hypothetical protein PALS1_082 [Staphylococcus phage PALS_1]|nr:hypothetical protein PALS1_082 [Staphylococcus phage PALS_1]